MTETIATRPDVIDWWLAEDDELDRAELTDDPVELANATWDALVTKNSPFDYDDALRRAVEMDETPEEFVSDHFEGFGDEAENHLVGFIETAFEQERERLRERERRAEPDPEPTPF